MPEQITEQITHNVYMMAGYIAMVLNDLCIDDTESTLPPPPTIDVLEASLSMALWLVQHSEVTLHELETQWECTTLGFSGRELVDAVANDHSLRWRRAWACSLCLPLHVADTPSAAWLQEWTPWGHATAFLLRRVYRSEQDQDWNIMAHAHSQDPEFIPQEQEFRLYTEVPDSVVLRCVMTAESYHEIRTNILSMMQDAKTQEALPVTPLFLREAQQDAPKA